MHVNVKAYFKTSASAKCEIERVQEIIGENSYSLCFILQIYTVQKLLSTTYCYLSTRLSDFADLNL